MWVTGGRLIGALVGGGLVAHALLATVLLAAMASGAAFGFDRLNIADIRPVPVLVASLVILLLGPGRFALDYGRGWTTHPKWGSWALAVLGIGAAVALWVVFNGTNPLGSPGNPG